MTAADGWYGGWYDAEYGDDPSTDNVFGREDRLPRRDAALHAFLAAGGRLSERPRMRDASALIALLDQVLAGHM
jgi:hypothetical protein